MYCRALIALLSESCFYYYFNNFHFLIAVLGLVWYGFGALCVWFRFQFQFRFGLVYVGCFVCYFDSLLCVVWTDCMPVSMHFHESPCKVKWHFIVCFHFAFGCWMLDTRFGAIALILTEKVFLRKSHSAAKWTKQ